MKMLKARALTATALVVGSLAAASPAQAFCGSSLLGLGPRTIGAAGDEVVTTPYVSVRLCGEPDVSGVPTPRVENYGTGDFAVFIDFAPGSETENLVLAVVVGDSYTEVPIPTDVTIGNSVCLFFHGSAYENPGGCLLFVER